MNDSSAARSPLGSLPGDARRARQMERVGDEVEPRTHLHLAVVAHVVRAVRAAAEKRSDDRACEIVGVDVIRIDVVVGASAGVPCRRRSSGRRVGA
jgi:hypothetical protein